MSSLIQRVKHLTDTNRPFVAKTSFFRKIEISFMVSNIIVSLLVLCLAASATDHLWAVVPLFLFGWAMADIGSSVFHYLGDTEYFKGTILLRYYTQLYMRHHHDPKELVRNGPFANTGWVAGVTLIPFQIFNLMFYAYTPLVCFGISCFLLPLYLAADSHRFSHMEYNEIPIWGKILQKLGLFITREQHAIHHKNAGRGILKRFSILAGWTNRFI
jgi:hypothetical protein